MGRAAALFGLTVAAGLTLLDVGWWFLLGTKGRALASDLDWYFADEHSRLIAMLGQDQVGSIPGQQGR